MHFFGHLGGENHEAEIDHVKDVEEDQEVKVEREREVVEEEAEVEAQQADLTTVVTRIKIVTEIELEIEKGIGIMIEIEIEMAETTIVTKIVDEIVIENEPRTKNEAGIRTETDLEIDQRTAMMTGRRDPNREKFLQVCISYVPLVSVYKQFLIF